LDRVRRVHDRGPLHFDKARANSIATFLRSTGLYESVKVEGSTVNAGSLAAPSFKPSDAPGNTVLPTAEKSLDDLSSLLDESPAADPASSEEADAG
jgi:hypothetical protein